MILGDHNTSCHIVDNHSTTRETIASAIFLSALSSFCCQEKKPNVYITRPVFAWANHLTNQVGLSEQPTYHKKHKLIRNEDLDTPLWERKRKGTISYRQLNSIHIINSRVLLEEQVKLDVMIRYRRRSDFTKQGRGYVMGGAAHPGTIIPLREIYWISRSSLLQAASKRWLCRSITSRRKVFMYLRDLVIASRKPCRSLLALGPI